MSAETSRGALSNLQAGEFVMLFLMAPLGDARSEAASASECAVAIMGGVTSSNVTNICGVSQDVIKSLVDEFKKSRLVLETLSYKQDAKRKQTREQLSARQEILIELKNGVLEEAFGFSVRAPDTLALDPSGDQLDALLCAIQAAWAWNNRATGFGAPSLPDPLEGWIANPLSKNSSTAF